MNHKEKVSEHFYYMEFKGNYQLENLLNQGGAQSNSEMAIYIEQILKGKKVNKVFKEEVPLNTGCAVLSAYSRFTLDHPITIIAMELTFVVVFIVVYLVMYLTAKSTVSKMNEQLKKLKQN